MSLAASAGAEWALSAVLAACMLSTLALIVLAVGAHRRSSSPRGERAWRWAAVGTVATTVTVLHLASRV